MTSADPETLHETSEGPNNSAGLHRTVKVVKEWLTHLPQYTVLSSVPLSHNLNQPRLLAAMCNSQHYTTTTSTFTLQRLWSALSCHSTSQKRKFTDYFSTKALGSLQDRRSITWDPRGLRQPAALLFTSSWNHSLPASLVSTCVNSPAVISTSDRDDLPWRLSTSDFDLWCK